MIIDRVNQIIEYEDISVRAFEQKIGASNGLIRNAIKKQSDIQGKWLETIIDLYPHISSLWLLTGKDSMLLEENTYTQKNDKVQVIYDDDEGEKIGIPYYDIDISAGYMTMFDDIKSFKPDYYFVIPNIIADASYPVYGDSMFPKFAAGDIVLVQKVQDLSIIQYGEDYIIVTQEFRTLKTLRKYKEDNSLVTLVPNNEKNYDPFEIPKKSILEMYLVKGKVRKSTM